MTLDSTGKKTLKSNMFAAIDLHFPRDPEEYSFEGSDVWDVLYNFTFDKLGLLVGFKISSDPLQTLFCGLNYRIWKGVSLFYGFSWQNDLQPSVAKIGDITSLAEAENFLKRDYGKPIPIFGLSFDPSIINNILGIK